MADLRSAAGTSALIALQRYELAVLV
jgi:hypothetical protein